MDFSSQELPYVQDPTTGVQGNLQYVVRGDNALDEADKAKRARLRAILRDSQPDLQENLSFLEQIEATQRGDVSETQPPEDHVVVNEEITEETEFIPEEEFLAMQEKEVTPAQYDEYISAREFLVLDDKKDSNQDTTYTSKDEIIDDLQEMVKLLRFKPGSSINPEVFFRGINNREYLSEAIDRLMKTPEFAGEIKMKSPVPEFLNDDSMNSSVSQNTVIYVPSQSQTVEVIEISSEEPLLSPTPPE